MSDAYEALIAYCEQGPYENVEARCRFIAEPAVVFLSRHIVQEELTDEEAFEFVKAFCLDIVSLTKERILQRRTGTWPDSLFDPLGDEP
jgi:hypothetical protein